MPRSPFRLPAWLTPLVVKVIHAGARWTRPMTLGARAVILDGGGRVYLVRHSYVRGWHLPGGGVEPGEPVMATLRREVLEEAGIEVLGEPVLHGLFFNGVASRRDHIAIYVVRSFRPAANASGGGLEIVDRGFFPPDALPEGTTRATRRRIAEVLDGLPPAADW